MSFFKYCQERLYLYQTIVFSTNPQFYENKFLINNQIDTMCNEIHCINQIHSANGTIQEY